MRIKLSGLVTPIEEEIKKDTLGRRTRKLRFNSRFIFKLEEKLKAEFLKFAENKGTYAGEILRQHMKRVLRDERARQRKNV